MQEYLIKLNDLYTKGEIDIDTEVFKDDNLDKRIHNLENARVKGSVYIDSQNEIVLSCEFKGTMYIDDSVTLESVPYDFCLSISENLEDIEENYYALAKAYVELREYFDSMRAGFDISVRFNTGTPFQKKVWNALNSIPYGGTASYEDIALMLTDGSLPEARKITRAVGAACSDNPVAVIVPCHRVIGKDGSIVGYAAGIDIKDYLLLHESFTAVTPLISKEG